MPTQTAIEALAGWPWDAIREWLTLVVLKLGGGAAVLAAVKGSKAAKAAARAAEAATRQAQIAEAQLRPVLRIDWLPRPGEREIVIRNLGAGRATALTAELSLALVGPNKPPLRHAETGELAPVLMPGSDARYRIPDLSAVPRFVEDTFDNVSISTALLDGHRSGSSRITVSLRAEQLPQRATIGVTLRVWCWSVLGDRIHAEAIEWEQFVTWSERPTPALPALFSDESP